MSEILAETSPIFWAVIAVGGFIALAMRLIETDGSSSGTNNDNDEG